jgi:hypothetical protein
VSFWATSVWRRRYRRTIGAFPDEALSELSPVFGKLYMHAKGRRRAVAVRTHAGSVLYRISEWQLIKQHDHNLLFRWFVDPM